MPRPIDIAWPDADAELDALQRRLAQMAESTTRWRPPNESEPVVAGVFVAFPRGAAGSGGAGDPAWVGAAALRGGTVVARVGLTGNAGGAYAPGLLALREGRLLEAGCQMLGMTPDLVLVDATGRDHPRRAGLALHLGAALDIPSVGVTDRPLVAAAGQPGPERGAHTALMLGDEVVGYTLRSQAGTRPLCVHAGWGTSPEVALAVILALTRGTRTPEPLREARRIARTLRAGNVSPGTWVGAGA